MLDDLKYIHERDAQDALGIAEKQWQQLAHSFELSLDKQPPVQNVVYAGMGGSSLAAMVSSSWPGYKVPFEICRQYDVPAYVDRNTLFIAASYSGNTEEIISAVNQAKARDAQVIIIAGGGKLQEFAETNSYPLLVLPKAEQPRYAMLYNLKALVVIMEKFGVANTTAPEVTMRAAADFIKDVIPAWSPTVHSADNPAKKLALELMGKSPVIYAGPLLYPAAYKWKISCNENAKNVAWCSETPEFNHNEFIGWSSHPVDKPYAIVDLRSNLEHERIQQRFKVSERLLSGMRPHAHTVDVQGNTLLEQLLWAIAFGDFVTLYLAMLNGVNPTPVELVEKLKKELG